MLNKVSGTKYLNVWLIAMVDVFLSVLVTFLTILSLRHFENQYYTGDQIISVCIISFFSSIMAFYLCKTYRNIIRYSRLRDAMSLFLASLAKNMVLLIVMSVLIGPMTFSDMFSYGIIDILATFLVLLMVRAIMITLYESIYRRGTVYSTQNVLIYGIGEVSVSLVSRLNGDKKYTVRGFYADDKNGKNFRLVGLEVFSYNEDEKDEEERFGHMLRRKGIQCILFPNTLSVRKESERLIPICQKYHIKVLISPPVGEFENNIPSNSHLQFREIEVEDLLNRPEIKIDINAVKNMLRDTVVLVTGAAGSIGSEICRQLSQMGVRHILMFDMAETPLHNLRLEFQDKYPYQRISPIIGDVRYIERLTMVFEQYRPTIVFHAAAYKHVPLMEENPCEAVLVNILGSKNVADMCLRYGVQKMIMISTDKAVNPTNFMGASKRMAEIYVQSLGMAVSSGQINGRTRYITTRFGNVLGSNGSVVPRFREQISKGGPVTVTHPDIIRFFMTIPEACRLVLEAGTLGKDNEIFVFDMGDPVKIVDLARRMISLSGLREGEDIKIEYTGLRPGEKLYEEVLSDKESTMPTTQDKIRIAQARQYDYEKVNEALRPIIDNARQVKIPAMVALVRDLVPEYKSQNSWLEKL